MEMRPEYTLRDNLHLFPLEEGGWRFEYDSHAPAYSINYPNDEEFAWGTNPTTYLRCGNFVVTYIKDNIQSIGTLYTSDEGAWMVIAKNGCIQASGSGGFPLRKPEPCVMDIRETVPYKSKSRFDDIDMRMDEEDKDGRPTES